MKKIHVLLAALLLLCTALPVLAVNNAEFQGNCTNRITGGVLYTDCDFDANRAPGGGTATTCTYGVNYLGWDFDTSISSDDLWFTSDFTPSYTYTGQFCDFIYLSVFCNGGSNAGTQHCMCNYVGIGGCIIPGAGWTP